MGYIPPHALENLQRYSYKAVDRSLISRYVLNRFWNWFVTLWPLTVAPNTITLLGLLVTVCNFLTLLYFDPAYLTDKGDERDTNIPRWVYLSWAVGLFLYQTLDAIDGKQARRTGMAGPLGELFDHACDALNTTLEVILAAHALNLGHSWWTVVSQCASLANFYLTTWEEYHTGQLYLGVFNGPVEGILMVVVIFVISFLYGPSLWDAKILKVTRLDQISLVARFIPNVKLNEAFLVVGAIGLAFNILVSYTNVLHVRKSKSQSAFRPLLYLLPFPTAVALQILWLAYPTFQRSAIIYSPLFVPFLCFWGVQFAHQVSRIILAHVTRTAYPWWDWMWIWSAIGALDVNLPWLFGRPPIIQSSPMRTMVFVYASLILSLIVYVRFCMLVINDITEYLGIACFAVRKKNEDGEWQELRANGNPGDKRS